MKIENTHIEFLCPKTSFLFDILLKNYVNKSTFFYFY